MYRADIINTLIQKNGYKSYLEIGVRKGGTFRRVRCKRKAGVDVVAYPDATYVMESDEFFKRNDRTYDIIFIDGLHRYEQVVRDIQNSLHILNKGGTIVCHDMNPTTKDMQEVPRKERKEWTGDCWKAWVVLRQHRNDLNMEVVDTDYGCGIIQKGRQKKLKVKESLTYENLDKNRKKWLNLISVEQFEKKYL